jgi:hypothetical protein
MKIEIKRLQYVTRIDRVPKITCVLNYRTNR